MEGIRIEVSGSHAVVTEKPQRITSGTVGLPVTITFDSPWDGMEKTVIFRAGSYTKTVEYATTGTVVPSEILTKPNIWLHIGVHGKDTANGRELPTIWASVSVIHVGATPGGPTITPGSENPILQEKTITKNGLYTPDEGYDGLSKVTVDVPVGVFPSGIKTITANGTHNVSGYAKAEVNVLSESGIALPNVQPMFLVKDIAFITPAITTAKVSVTLDDISNFVITEGE